MGRRACRRGTPHDSQPSRHPGRVARIGATSDRRSEDLLMGIRDTMRSLFAVEQLNTPRPTRIQTRQVTEGSLEDFAIRVLGNRGTKLYRKPSIRETLQVPAVLNAVTKI